MIVSDGYDTGAPELLAREMAALRRRTKRIVWLNPMIGWAGYEPAAGGMQAALPYVALFAPAHNPKNLEALAPYLAQMQWRADELRAGEACARTCRHRVVP